MYDDAITKESAGRKIREWTMERIITAALAHLESGAEEDVAQPLVIENGMDEDLARKFASDFAPHVRAMSGALEEAGTAEGIADLFADHLRRWDTPDEGDGVK